jgi:peptidoglycan/xylan/chitin deacetylase (PgdA/CDA1 family)
MKNKRQKQNINLNFFLIVFFILSVLLSGCSTNMSNKNSNNSTISENKNETSSIIDDTIKNENSLSNKNESENSDSNSENEKPSTQEVEKDITPSEENTLTITNEKIAYLTFDDGPSTEVTPEILKTLDQYNIKATFFVLGSKAEKYPDLVLQEHNSGHIVANHTYGHDEEYLYASPDNFMKDIYKAEDVLKKIIPGYDYKLLRFPQGSFQNKKAAHREAVSAAGYHYVDWNCINGDYLANTLETDKIIEQIKETYNNQKKLIVLMHDATPKTTTAEALPAVIEFLQEEGYTFKTLEALTK